MRPQLNDVIKNIKSLYNVFENTHEFDDDTIEVRTDAIDNLKKEIDALYLNVIIKKLNLKTSDQFLIGDYVKMKWYDTFAFGTITDFDVDTQKFFIEFNSYYVDDELIDEFTNELDDGIWTDDLTSFTKITYEDILYEIKDLNNKGFKIGDAISLNGKPIGNIKRFAVKIACVSVIDKNKNCTILNLDDLRKCIIL